MGGFVQSSLKVLVIKGATFEKPNTDLKLQARTPTVPKTSSKRGRICQHFQLASALG